MGFPYFLLSDLIQDSLFIYQILKINSIHQYDLTNHSLQPYNRPNPSKVAIILEELKIPYTTEYLAPPANPSTPTPPSPSRNPAPSRNTSSTPTTPPPSFPTPPTPHTTTQTNLHIPKHPTKHPPPTTNQPTNPSNVSNPTAKNRIAPPSYLNQIKHVLYI
ncbi:uncharacterized protein EAE98_004483 [Botrytis deweyae]|uniref:GST N-terminal domain-containing protein n=1 Tax=Botrytis deweyae TaxID=2478750 RepID=A0ABQ7IR09_9HELO|nr:uncharacterized protein EAE98_004483 [Botrytis deweyae]KAF7931747.1 hypothetical protein EAE98_004483 [Botrytis deweyae]